jgi:hypothetical protein
MDKFLGLMQRWKNFVPLAASTKREIAEVIREHANGSKGWWDHAVELFQNVWSNKTVREFLIRKGLSYLFG